MDYSKPLFVDFARRTQKNLVFIQAKKDEQPGLEVYEVTQLINSLLGLLVFPQQRYYSQIPKTPLTELSKQGWPIPRVVGGYPQVSDLRQLLRYMRNAVAHSNLRFLSDESLQIRGVEVWNTRQDPNRPGRVKITWMATLSIEDLEKITEKFIQLIVNNHLASTKG